MSKILVVGGGGREHAIVWKIAQSRRPARIYCAPGNGGISDIAECVPCKATDIEGITDFAVKNRIDMVVVAPDDPLAAGMVDALEASGIRAFGPVKAAAEIESSKVISKGLMHKYGIPTAEYGVFTDSGSAVAYLENAKYPIVVKADGLALGKGVIIAGDFAEAAKAVKTIMVDRAFGKSGDKVVIEEYLEGNEVTILAFTDGVSIAPMVSSQDHKRAFDGDKGPNTGGMGTFSPSRIYDSKMADLCMKKIFRPSVDALNIEGRTFKGVLYFGLMLTGEGPKLLEYNARFGDPETQVVLPRLKTDILDIFDSIIDCRLDPSKIEWDDNASVCVVAASGGYPVSYVTGYEINGLKEAQAVGGVTIFHAGTKKENGRYYTSGGRVLGVTAVGPTLDGAISRAYESIGQISFADMYYRHDIGIKSTI